MQITYWGVFSIPLGERNRIDGRVEMGQEALELRWIYKVVLPRGQALDVSCTQGL